MRCPTCGAKFPKNANICLHCGTQLSQIQKASNKAVVKARKEYQPELVVYSSVFPNDLSYKKTLLLCIFLGLFGAHRYYTKQTLSAVIMTVLWSLMLFFSTIMGLQMGGFINVGDIGITSNVLSSVFGVVSFAGACVIIKWGFDLFRLIFKGYKVPVVLAEKDLKGK